MTTTGVINPAMYSNKSAATSWCVRYRVAYTRSCFKLSKKSFGSSLHTTYWKAKFRGELTRQSFISSRSTQFAPLNSPTFRNRFISTYNHWTKTPTAISPCPEIRWSNIYPSWTPIALASVSPR
jgi:hypothetical protein